MKRDDVPLRYISAHFRTVECAQQSDETKVLIQVNGSQIYRFT
jgi:hypothetical protein